MSDFLLELRSEEIPARMQAKARDDLARLFTDYLGDDVRPSSITTYATPRRLALIARDLPTETPQRISERKGPRADAPDAAIAGFLKSAGLTREQLEERPDGRGGATLFAVRHVAGEPMTERLKLVINSILSSFPWPKSMRWGAKSASTESLRWVRPLHGIVALFGEELVDVGDVEIPTSAATLGHRFHHPRQITIGGAHDYVEKLRACHVLVDQDERARIIRDRAAEAAAQAGLRLVEDEGLVAENAGLTEWPVPLLGRFDQAFLDVPPEVIQLTARVNQKYFVCRDEAGQLANAFVCTANIEAADGGAKIVEGNRKVLAARLSDARFFYDTDRKVPLEEQAKKLDRIVFHEKLGTVADKVERVAKLAEWLATEGVVPGCDPALARRAADLCKADLVTGMVGEFPELQGLMGGYYAAAQGEPREVAEAIRDHYKPVGQGDDVPTAPVTVAVSLADKLDTLFAFFDQKMLPTGSKDPFALRRAALGVLRLIQTNAIQIRIVAAARFWGASAGLGVILSDFLQDRLGVQLREAGVRYDFVQASSEWSSSVDDRLDRVKKRAEALQAFVGSEDGANLLAGYKRAANILKKEGGMPEGAAANPAPEPAEAALHAALDAAEPAAADAIAREDFEAAMAALATLRAPIDAFFDAVTVNDADRARRASRLALLDRVRRAVHGVADFSRIEG